MHNTLPLLSETDFPPVVRSTLETLQVNLGYRCNQQCLHCHVNAGPKRSEVMQRETVDTVVDFLTKQNIATLDLTGGAPELNPYFRDLVKTARERDIHVIDRCNLTILQEPDQHDLAEFLAVHQVEIMASLPCYIEANVNAQRGKGVFSTSIAALQQLNSLGYGQDGRQLILNLVYNPQGPQLPPPQQQLENDYKVRLKQDYGVVFNRLFTIANMPINRFGSMLVSKGQFDSYMQTLRSSYRRENLPSIMCRSLISVDWQGFVYDCDFNQMLGLPLHINQKPRPHLRDLIDLDLSGRPITVLDHCYACTAGQGSSCGGALR